jgi:hypothetical protein
MKRIFSVLAVTALMVAMLVASVSPVLAKPKKEYTADCVRPETGQTLDFTGTKDLYHGFVKEGGWECSKPEPI